ncbi:competence protein ComEC family protein [Flavobacteriaceae bacterium]|nr:competence protein ComEC family protein [Flavobacteriaceae bacterium]
MKKLLGYLPFHFLLFLIAGICCQFYTDYWNYGIVISACILIFLSLTAYWQRKTLFFVFITWITFFLTGMILVYENDATNHTNYFEKHLKNTSKVILAIDKVLKPGNYHHKYVADVVQVDSKKTTGHVLLNIEKDSTSLLFHTGDLVFLKNKFQDIKSSLNPHQFNYKHYLKKQGINQQVYITHQEILLLDESKVSLLRFIDAFRIKIQKSLRRYHFTDDELAVMNALLLGQRQEISKQLSDNYSKAGAIHILAVSGLHVGIILLILSFVLKPLERVNNGKLIKLVLVILSLWFFAILAGLSASVIRAVTMFSAIALGQFFNKRNAVEHSLIFSMFIILLWKPLFLFDVGFQLSYTAVFGIIWIQPVLYQLWKSNFFIVDKGWQLITVSVAAQLGVLPISLFYFHQFPALFFISNLIIIPFLGVILGLGLVVLVLSYESTLPVFLEGFYGDVISILNKVVAFVARQESFLFSEISFSALKMIFSYLLIISGFQLFLKLNTKRCFLFFGSILAFQCVLILEKYTIAQKSEFIVFHKSENSIIGIRKGSSFELYHSMDSLQISSQKLLINYKVGENISSQNYHKLSNLMYYDKQVVLIIDKDGLYDIKELNNPIVLLRQSPKINLQRLVKKLKPAIIIADGSNYKSFIENWKTTCENLKTPFWTTYNQGAYVLN